MVNIVYQNKTINNDSKKSDNSNIIMTENIKHKISYLKHVVQRCNTTITKLCNFS